MNENMRLFKKKFNITDFITSKGWEKAKDGSFRKGFNTIKFVGQNKRLMVVLNFDRKVKHKHIVTCLIPSSESEATILFELTMLND